MGEDLNGWLGHSRIHAARHTELGADVVGACRCRVARKYGFSEVSALLGLVLGESSGIEVGLWHGDIEDSGAGRDCDRDGHVDACFGSC